MLVGSETETDVPIVLVFHMWLRVGRSNLGRRQEPRRLASEGRRDGGLTQAVAHFVDRRRKQDCAVRLG
jgi:hypothetical protein